MWQDSRSEPGFAELVAKVESYTGIRPRSTILDRLKTFCEQRVSELTLASTANYLEYLERTPGEWAALVPVVSVGESFFYRDQRRWQALEEVIIPRLAKSVRDRPLRILSAGCSTGEEAYGLAEVCERVALDHPGMMVDVVGVDINPKAIAAARAGVFGENSLRDVAKDSRARLFVLGSKRNEVRGALRRRVRFEQRNLLDWTRQPQLPSYDLILCQNVVIYFSEQTTARVVDALVELLYPDGLLLMGHSEVTNLPELLQMESVGESYCFRKKAPVATDWAAWRLRQQPELDTELSTSIERAWNEVIREDFVAAAMVLRTVPAGPMSAAERHLRAWILLCQGDLSRSRGLVEQSLRADDTDPESHFASAILAQARGAWSAAQEAYRRAVSLAPGFSAAHFHLAELLWEAGQAEQAQRAWRSAAQAAAGDQTRVQRYCGGFDVATFIQVCEARCNASIAGVSHV
jgi:chemotaxis protein methyltransferase CheR